MRFEICVQRYGVMTDKFMVHAVKAGSCGIWHESWPWIPRHDHMLKGLPYGLRKAFARNPLWWQSNGLSDILRCDLWRKSDFAPMGSIYARFIAD